MRRQKRYALHKNSFIHLASLHTTERNMSAAGLEPLVDPPVVSEQLSALEASLPDDAIIVSSYDGYSGKERDAVGALDTTAWGGTSTPLNYERSVHITHRNMRIPELRFAGCLAL